MFDAADLRGPAARKLLGQRVGVRGRVLGLGHTNYNHRAFWGCPPGLAYAALSDDPDSDFPEAVAVFLSGSWGPLRRGERWRVYGTFRGYLPTTGCPILVDCQDR